MKHLKRIGLGALAILVLIFFSFLCLGVVGLVDLLFWFFCHFPDALRWTIVTALVVGGCYGVGRSMEDKKP